MPECAAGQAILTIIGSGYPAGARHAVLVTGGPGGASMSESVASGPSSAMRSTQGMPLNAEVVVESFVDVDGDGACDLEHDEVLRFIVTMSEDREVDVSFGVESGAPPSCEGFQRFLSYDVVTTVRGLPEDGYFHATLIAEAPSGFRWVVGRASRRASGGVALLQFDGVARHGLNHLVAWRMADVGGTSCLADEIGGVTEPLVAEGRLSFVIDAGTETATCALMPGSGADVTVQGTGFDHANGGSARAALVEASTGLVIANAFERISGGMFGIAFVGQTVPGLEYRVAIDAGPGQWLTCGQETETTWWVDVPEGGHATLDSAQPMDEGVCMAAFQAYRAEF